MRRTKTDEIGMLVRSLTYGEMMELAEAMAKQLGVVDTGKMAKALHAWATERDKGHAEDAPGVPEHDTQEEPSEPAVLAAPEVPAVPFAKLVAEHRVHDRVARAVAEATDLNTDIPAFLRRSKVG